MENRSSIRLFALSVFVLPLLSFWIFSLIESRQELPVIERAGANGKMRERQQYDVATVNQDGRVVNSAEWQGKIVVVDFFFTHCAVVCPKMTANLKKVSDRFPDDDDIRFNSFTVDPERDSATQLANYAKRFSIDNRKWNLLTGDKREIYKLARNSFMVVATDGDGGPDDFIHSEKFVLLDRAGRIRGYYTGTDNGEVEKLIKDIKRLKNEK